MINKYDLIAMLVGMAICLVMFLKDPPVPPTGARPYQPLEGTLYSSPVKETGHPGNLSPKASVAGSDVKRLGLGRDPEILLKVVPDSQAQYRLLPKERRTNRMKDKIEKSTGTIPSPGADSPPAREDSLKFFNTILEKSESAYLLNNHYIKDGVTFEAEALCRWNGLYILRFKVANDEDREFFSTKVKVQVNGETLASNLYAPFSCQPLGGIEGIVTFSAGVVRNKRVSLILVEGAGRGRMFPLDVDYGF